MKSIKNLLSITPTLLSMVLASMIMTWEGQAAGGGATLYALTFSTRQLITVNTNTGVGTLVTNLTLMRPYDIASRDGSLYLLCGDTSGKQTISELDPFTGQALSTQVFTNLIGGGEGALDFDAKGYAYATKSSNDVGTFFRMDLATSGLKMITAENGMSPSLDGLAFDTNGVLYGLMQGEEGGSAFLYIVNPLTGATARVGTWGGITFSPSVGGLAFAPDGTLYAALGGTVESRFYRVNKTTGSATLVGAIGFPNVCGIRFHTPRPGPLRVQRSLVGLRMNWPHQRGGVLQVRPIMEGGWRDAGLSVATNGSEAVAIAPWSSSQAYFRLSSGILK